MIWRINQHLETTQHGFFPDGDWYVRGDDKLAVTMNQTLT